MNKMKTTLKILSVIALVVMINSTTAQHLTIKNLYTQNQFLFNPAYTGSEGVAFVDAQNQWVGWDDAPESYTFGIHSQIGNSGMNGLGLLISRDSYGIYKRTAGAVNYSYSVKFDEEAINKLSFGISGGFVDNRTTDVVGLEGYSDNAILDAEEYEGVTFSAGFGLKYSWNDKLKIGFAMPQIFEDATYDFKPYINANVGYKFYAVADKMEIEPSVMLRNYKASSVGEYSNGQYDLNMYMCYDQTVWIGGTYRNNFGEDPSAAYILKAGVTLSNIGIGYAYQKMVDDFAPSGGTHEICISYYFDKARKDKLNENLMNNNQYELLMEDSAALKMTDDDYQNQIDSLKKEIETLKQLMQIKDLKDWADGFREKIKDYEDQIDGYEDQIQDEAKFEPVYFDVDKFDLLAQYKDGLDRLAKKIIDENLKVELIGHADDTGPAWYNQELSEKRSNTVFQYLVNKGCNKNNFIVVGRGETVPAAKGESDDARKLNRRVEFRIIQ